MLYSSTLNDAPQDKFTIFDVDDTLWHLKLGEFKHYPFLLPIMLYITHTPHLHWGIATNRHSKDEKPLPEDPSLTELLTLLSRFGIITASDLVLTHNEIKAEQNSLYEQDPTHPDLKGKNLLLKALLTALNTRLGFNLPEQFFEKKPLPSQPTILEHHKKEELLPEEEFSTFLNQEEDAEINLTQKTSMDFSQIIFLDDDGSGSILPPAAELGCQTIQAIHFEKETETQKNTLSFNPAYLIQLAEEIGLIDYIHSLKANAKWHKDDNPLRKLAALLFAPMLRSVLDFMPHAKENIQDAYILPDELEDYFSLWFSKKEYTTHDFTQCIDAFNQYYTERNITPDSRNLSEETKKALHIEITQSAYYAAWRRTVGPILIKLFGLELGWQNTLPSTCSSSRDNSGPYKKDDDIKEESPLDDNLLKSFEALNIDDEMHRPSSTSSPPPQPSPKPGGLLLAYQRHSLATIPTPSSNNGDHASHFETIELTPNSTSSNESAPKRSSSFLSIFKKKKGPGS